MHTVATGSWPTVWHRVVGEESTTAGEQRPVTRAEALAALARQQAAWDDLVARLGPDRLDLPGAMGAWTFKDLADHLTIWEQYELARLTAALAGESEPAPPWPPELTEDDARNAWMQARTATRSGAVVLAEAHAIFDEVAALVRQMPEEYLNSPASIPWVAGLALGPALVRGEWLQFSQHYQEEHAAEVEAWLAGLPAAGR